MKKEKEKWLEEMVKKLSKVKGIDKATWEEIINKLNEIMARLQGCNHEWEFVEGNTTLQIQCCKKCGEYRCGQGK